MSFLGDLLNSIGGEKAPAPPAPPVKPPSRPSSTNPTQSNATKSAPSTPSAGSTAKPVYKGTAGTVLSQQGGGLKRKAEEISTERPVKLSKPSLPVRSDENGQKPSKSSGSETKSPTIPSSSNGLSSSQPSQSTSKPAAKPPAKGSYAAMLARAKEAQQAKTPSQIGVIKHQSKEKIKPSKLAERKREDQEKSKGATQPQSSKPSSSGKADPRRRSASPVKKGEQSGPKQPKVARPPLHAPAYKGTIGQAPRPPKEEERKKSSKRDEYLGTDEEDEGDYDSYGDEEDYYSDASDAMEAGLDDIEAENIYAERVAREDDAKELALEQKLKREKMERKQKLAALAKRQR